MTGEHVHCSEIMESACLDEYDCILINFVHYLRSEAISAER